MTAAELLAQAAPDPPPPPSPQVLSAAGGLVGKEASQCLLAIRGAWPTARLKVSAAQRRIRKSVGSRDRRLLGDLLYAAIRGDRHLGIALELLGLPAGARPETAAAARILAALQLYFGLPPEASRQAWPGEDLAWEHASSVPTLLQPWARKYKPSPNEALGAAASLPDWLAQELLADHGSEAPKLALALNQRAAICLRTLGPGADRNLLLTTLRQQGVEADACSNSPHGLRLRGRANIHELREIRSGQLFVQDEGSQLIAEFVAPEPGQCVVDACAGAGGKTLALASLMKDKGRIIAADPRAHALKEARGRAKAAHLRCIRTVELPASGPGLPGPLAAQLGRADRVLVDAPCSGTGALRRRPGARWLLSPPELTRLETLQTSILKRMAPLVRPGGRLIYATCSLLKRENEAIIEAFLSERRDFTLLPAKEVLGGARAQGLGDGYVLRLAPHLHETDGFFAAALERK